MDDAVKLWVGFNAFVLSMLVLDLGVFHRKSHEVSLKEALIWTGVWITLALMFNGFIYYYFNEELAVQFLTGYLIEKSLSVDNIFVILLIFSYFQVPPAYQHKVLFLGILGALVMRVIFIFAGIELIHRFHWLIYIFGAFLVITGIRMLFAKETNIDPEKNFFVRMIRRIIPVTSEYVSDKFFVRNNGRLWATPLFLALIVIEGTDLIFAVDSIPAVIAISDDPFIVYTSNAFAILGLRSLYFALAGIEKFFKYLKYGLALILVFVGTKMAIADFFKIPVEISLLVIAIILAASMWTSVISSKRESKLTNAGTDAKLGRRDKNLPREIGSDHEIIK
jgi:tellurite resistance protein TerC